MGGGGKQSSTTNQYMTDPESAGRMAGVAERQQAMAEEQWSMAREVFEPYERALMSEGIYDIEQNRPLKEMSRQQLMEEMQLSAPVMAAFYKEALKPVSEEERMSEATGEVVSGYADVPESMRRQLARTGTNLSGARQENLMKAIALDRAKSISGARTSARNEARNETFSKLRAAMAMRSGMRDTPYNTASTEGGYSVRNSADRAMGLYQNAISANEAGMRAMSKSKSSGWNFNFG